MNVKRIDIYIDGQHVKSSFCDCNGHIMIPFLVFKHACVLVDYDRVQTSLTLKRDKITITFYKNQFDVFIQEENQLKQETLAIAPIELNGDIYIPLDYVIKKLDMSILELTPDRLNLVTRDAWNDAVFYKGPHGRFNL